MESRTLPANPQLKGTKTRFGSFEFDTQRQELRKRGFRIALSASQLRLLQLFMERPGELITRQEISECLWTHTANIDVPTGINTAINRLRRTIQEAPAGPTSIETVIGLGYRFNAVLEEVEPSVDEVASPPAQPLSFGTAAPQPEPAAEVVPEPAVHPGSVLLDPTREDPIPQGSRPLPLRLRQRFLVLSLCGLLVLSAAVVFGLRQRTLHARKSIAAQPAAQSSSPSLRLIRITAAEDVGKLTAAAVAPSGESIAYANHFGVSVHWLGSGTERLLGSRPSFKVDRLSWFPDETSLLMSGTDGILHQQQVWRVPLMGAYIRPLLENASRAVISPDGNLLAFTRDKDRELWVADAEGQHPRRLRSARTKEHFGTIIWIPGGKRLIVLVHKIGAGQGRAGQAAVAEPPTQGAYECIDSAFGQVLNREEEFSADSGYVLSDGSFYFTINKTPRPETGSAFLMMVHIDPGTGRLLDKPELVRNFGARHAGSLTASYNGTKIAAVLDRPETNVFVANLRWPGPELTDVVQLTRGTKQSFPHSWSADAKGILYENDTLGRFSIFKQTLDGAEPSLIASLPGNAAMAQLSPDGRWILFLEVTGHPQHVVGIFRIPAAGGKLEQVPTRGDIEEFHCSASWTGRCVVREALGNEALVYYALEPGNGLGAELGRTPWQPNRLGDWGLSPDGTMIAAANHDTMHPGIAVFKLGTERTQVREIAVQGHGTVLGANWSADGKSLFVECRTESGFDLLSVDLAGRAKLLRQSSSLIWAVPSRDGAKIAFPSPTLSTSVWAMNR